MNDMALLRDKIVAHFNLDELRTVIVNIGPSIGKRPDDFVGGLGTVARELIGAYDRFSKIDELVNELARQKPSVDFSYWGGPPPKESLQAVLRQLISDAFTGSELSTLAFSLFSDIYDDVEAGRSKTQAVEMIVQHAIKHNAVLQLMEYVRNNNPHQYRTYFQRVDKALGEHKNAEPVYQPTVEPVAREQPQSSGVSDSCIVALQMYANGLDDGGALAKTTLGFLGYT